MKTYRWTIYLLPSLWTGLIFLLSLLPASDLPGKGWLNFPGSDKVMHYLFYLVLQLLWLLAMIDSSGQKFRKMFWIFTVCSLLGGIIEILQGFTPTRTPDVLDWLADISGILSGMLLFKWTIRIKQLLLARIKWLSLLFRP